MAERRIAVAMSGGVDSSTAAVILKEAGWDVIGFSMRLWDKASSASEREAGISDTEPLPDEFHDARAVAAMLDIPYHVLDLRKEFAQTIVRPFIEAYSRGYTPSPCIICNARMKFDRLASMAEDAGAAHIATGHYARISYDESSGRHRLLRARDKNKDQAYFLFELDQNQLANTMFPLGDLTKDRVRILARRYGLPVAGKSESQEICFIPDGDYAGFIERHYRKIMGTCLRREQFAPGPIVDTAGRILGVHRGIHRYTIGQRRGLGVAHSSPLYVLELDSVRNRIVVGERSQLGRRRCRVVQPNWISVSDLSEPLRVSGKIRSRHPEAPAVITPREDGSVDVLFDEPQPAVCPGQACVFYQEDIVIGGGWIARDRRNTEHG